VKKEDNYETTLVRRKRSKHSGIRNHHSGSSRVCWPIADHSAKSGSKADAHGPYKVSPYGEWNRLDDKGSVTAEFAIILPGVLLVLFIALSVLGLQASRIALVEVAAEAARALARGESEQLVSQLLAESQLGSNTTFQSSFEDLAVCVEVVQKHEIRALGGLFPIELAEIQCARKGGL
jgi:hypothetical protein